VIKWLQLNETQRLKTLQQASAESGIPIKAIEKDWWVTLVIRAIFQSKYAPYLLFKGGTSLSKCWKLIDRFSEDIDLALDRDYFGVFPEWTNTQVKKLKKKACAFTSNELRTAIEEQLHHLGVPPEIVGITAAEVKESMPDKDPQELLVHYQSLTDKLTYVEDVVKIEVSARSLKEPWKGCTIQSLLDEILPSSPFSEAPFAVPSVEPIRTFLEKLFLLHEEFQKELSKIRSFRMSRHLYDIVKIKDTEHGKNALTNDELYAQIVAHRKMFSFLPWVDYNLHQRKTLSFIPPNEIIGVYREDYTTMTTTMIFGVAPSFDEMINSLKKLLATIRNLEEKLQGPAVAE